jgi:hypothetical protein
MRVVEKASELYRLGRRCGEERESRLNLARFGGNLLHVAQYPANPQVDEVLGNPFYWGGDPTQRHHHEWERCRPELNEVVHRLAAGESVPRGCSVGTEPFKVGVGVTQAGHVKPGGHVEKFAELETAPHGAEQGGDVAAACRLYASGRGKKFSGKQLLFCCGERPAAAAQSLPQVAGGRGVVERERRRPPGELSPPGTGGTDDDADVGDGHTVHRACGGAGVRERYSVDDAAGSPLRVVQHDMGSHDVGGDVTRGTVRDPKGDEQVVENLRRNKTFLGVKVGVGGGEHSDERFSPTFYRDDRVAIDNGPRPPECKVVARAVQLKRPAGVFSFGEYRAGDDCGAAPLRHVEGVEQASHDALAEEDFLVSEDERGVEKADVGVQPDVAGDGGKRR